ncbi:MAG: RNA polymerase sigma factor [Planctomycetes bacterium]|nr:RNA polymerase sigma factor [Planctomycetota bacterium]
MHDRSLVEQALGGDRAAFTEVVRRHQGAVFGYLRARLFQPDDAEDLTQEVFLRFYAGRDRFNPSNRVRPWLLGIARNVLSEYVRAAKRRKESAWTELCLELDDLAQSDGHGGDDETFDDAARLLPDCLDTLGPSAREAVRLKYTGNWRLARIGEKLRRSEGAVKLLVFRAREALRHCLNDKLGRCTDKPR